MLSTKKVSLSKMDEHKRWFPLQEINIHTPHGLLTWKLEVNLNGICWRLKKKKMYNIVLSIIHVHVMGKTDRKKYLQSQTRDTSTVHSFFPSFLSSLPPNVAYCSSLTKSCPPTLEGPEDSKVSQQFLAWKQQEKFLSNIIPRIWPGFLSIFSIIVSLPLRILYPLL